jgi:hypothetical protein
MKYPKTITKFLNNKTIFYIVCFLAIANVLGYLFLGNFAGVFIFLIVGSFTYLFNKNKTVVLLVPLLVTSLFMMGKTVKEGFQDSKKKTDKNKSYSKKSADKTSSDKKSSDKKTLEPTSNTSGIISGPMEDTSTDKSEVEPEPNVAQTDGMSNKKGGNQWKNRIDHAATIEEAYGNLSNILGSDGIKGLTSDTQKLMKQQMQLAEAMKGMMPVVEQAQNMMKGLDLKSFDIKGLADMAKQFSPSA